MPDPTLSAAIKEAYASSPSGLVIYHTLEIWNPAFSAPIRVVRDTDSLDAMIEIGAPRDAGSVVTFTAYAFDIVLPELTTNSVPSCSVEIDNVDRLILSQIDLATISGLTTTVIYRQYLSTGLSIGPENLPVMTLTVLSVSATPYRIKMSAGFPDLLNRKFPALEYDPEVFNGLAG
ncbi:MAG: DUF1833 family protein [Cypionkella sp.]